MNITMNIEESFYFPVAEREIALVKDEHQLKEIQGYKAIIAPNKNDKVISVTKNSYKLIRNQELIEPFMEQVSKLGVRWKVDPSHSFCQLNRMRLQVTFPDILLKDEESDIPLSLYLHNSYDQSEGVRLFWGAIRSICSNGMIFGDVLGSLYARHTSGFSFDKLESQFNNVTDKICHVQNRVDVLRSASLDEDVMERVQKALGKRRLEEIIQTDTLPDISQWDLLNDITYFISHNEKKPKRARLQLAASKAFAL
jgi:hypothetical protein